MKHQIDQLILRLYDFALNSDCVYFWIYFYSEVFDSFAVDLDVAGCD